MSLYCFGKIELMNRYDFSSFRNAFHGVVLSPDVDSEDVAEIDSIKELDFEGSYFSICDGLGTREATGLWNEAMQQGGNAARSRLGKTVYQILFSSGIKKGGIAFVDGGIENVLLGSAANCWEWYSARIIKTWDTIDNPLLIWSEIK